VRIQEVLFDEELLLESVEERSCQSVVSLLSIDDHDHAELIMHRTETTVGAESESDKALFSIHCVVLVEHVVQTLIKTLLIDQNDDSSIGHAGLDLLEVQADVEVVLISRKVTAKEYDGAISLEHLGTEEDLQGGVVACEEHHVSCVLVDQVALDVSDHKRRLRAIRGTTSEEKLFDTKRETDASKELGEDKVELLGMTSKVAGDGCVEEFRSESLIEVAVEVLDEMVKVSETVKVLLPLLLVNRVIGLSK
jgi:hypothetical protein